MRHIASRPMRCVESSIIRSGEIVSSGRAT
jgi:hypothetical protein